MSNHEYTDDIVCPWCGAEFGDSWESFSHSDVITEDCQECGKPYRATRDIEVTYSTERVEP